MSRHNKTKYIGGAEVEKLQRTLEVERIVNLVKGFGWELAETKTDGDTLQITIKKTVLPLAAAVA